MKLLFKIILWAIIIFCGLMIFAGIGESLENGFDIYAIILILIFAGIIALCWLGIKKIKSTQPRMGKTEQKPQKKKRDYKKIILSASGVSITFLSAIKILSDGFSWPPLIFGFIGVGMIGVVFEKDTPSTAPSTKRKKHPIKSKNDIKKYVTSAIKNGVFSDKDQDIVSEALERFNLEPEFVEPILTKKFGQLAHPIVNEVMKTKLMTDEQWEQIKEIAHNLGVVDYEMDEETKAYHDNWLALQHHESKPDIFEGAEPEGFIRETKRKTEWRDVKETEVSMTYKDYEGNKTKRSVLIRRVSEYGAFEAFCLKRKAMRTFKIKSVVEMTDFKTGEILEDYKDVKAYFERLLK